jgi:hypothetical protein
MKLTQKKISAVQPNGKPQWLTDDGINVNSRRKMTRRDRQKVTHHRIMQLMPLVYTE